MPVSDRQLQRSRRRIASSAPASRDTVSRIFTALSDPDKEQTHQEGCVVNYERTHISTRFHILYWIIFNKSHRKKTVRSIFTADYPRVKKLARGFEKLPTDRSLLMLQTAFLDSSAALGKRFFPDLQYAQIYKHQYLHQKLITDTQGKQQK